MFSDESVDFDLAFIDLSIWATGAHDPEMFMSILFFGLCTTINLCFDDPICLAVLLVLLTLLLLRLLGLALALLVLVLLTLRSLTLTLAWLVLIWGMVLVLVLRLLLLLRLILQIRPSSSSLRRHSLLILRRGHTWIWPYGPSPNAATPTSLPHHHLRSRNPLRPLHRHLALLWHLTSLVVLLLLLLLLLNSLDALRRTRPILTADGLSGSLSGVVGVRRRSSSNLSHLLSHPRLLHHWLWHSHLLSNTHLLSLKAWLRLDSYSSHLWHVWHLLREVWDLA